jgi:hypothetical protein
VDPSELNTGAQPWVNDSMPASASISTGAAPVATNGVSAAPEMAGSLAAGGARATASVSGTAILFTWIAIVVLLVAANVLTLRVQG